MEELSVTGLTDSLRTAIETLKDISSKDPSKELREHVQCLQAALLDTQAEVISVCQYLTKLQVENRKLQEQLTARDDWNDQIIRYSIVCPWKNGAQVYGLKQLYAAGEPPTTYVPTVLIEDEKLY